MATKPMNTDKTILLCAHESEYPQAPVGLPTDWNDMEIVQGSQFLLYNDNKKCRVFVFDEDSQTWKEM